MLVTTSALRQNIYRLLDQVIETGIPIEIKRKGIILKIILSEKKDKLENLKERNIINCEPDELVHIDWSSEWKA